MSVTRSTATTAALKGTRVRAVTVFWNPVSNESTCWLSFTSIIADEDH